GAAIQSAQGPRPAHADRRIPRASGPCGRLLPAQGTSAAQADGARSDDALERELSGQAATILMRIVLIRVAWRQSRRRVSPLHMGPCPNDGRAVQSGVLPAEKAAPLASPGSFTAGGAETATAFVPSRFLTQGRDGLLGGHRMPGPHSPAARPCLFCNIRG